MNRIYTVLVFALFALGACGQGTARTVLFDCTDDLRPSFKIVVAQVKELDRNAIASIDGPVLKVRIGDHVAQPRLLAALNGLGIGQFVPKAMDRTASDRPAALGSNYPEFIDTGSPSTDEANYEAAKQDWIRAHPELYEVILQHPFTGAEE